jgi:hypothetical protein
LCWSGCSSRRGAALAAYLVLASNGGNGGPATYARLQPVRFTDFGTNIGRMAEATGLVVPSLRSLDGYPLIEAPVGPEGLAGLAYGPHRSDNGVITVNLAGYRPGNRQAAGTVYRRMFNNPRWPHHTGPISYAETDGGQIIFPFRSEWVGVTTMRGNPGAQDWAKIIRAILAAPTR